MSGRGAPVRDEDHRQHGPRGDARLPALPLPVLLLSLLPAGPDGRGAARKRGTPRDSIRLSIAYFTITERSEQQFDSIRFDSNRKTTSALPTSDRPRGGGVRVQPADVPRVRRGRQRGAAHRGPVLHVPVLERHRVPSEVARQRRRSRAHHAPMARLLQRVLHECRYAMHFNFNVTYVTRHDYFILITVYQYQHFNTVYVERSLLLPVVFI